MRTIAEILAYKRNYSPELNPNLFDEEGQMIPEVRDKILEIVDAFLDYTQIKEDIKVSDIRVVGSNASYNYNEDSDLDVHIVTDLSKISKPETIAQLYFGEVKHAFKEAYDITIKGIEVELYVEDVNASAVTNGIYSVMQDKWIKEPTPMEDPSDEEIAQAEEIEDEIMSKLGSASPEEKEDIIDQLYVMRKDALASKGETAPANLAFKSLRNKGVLNRAKDDIKKSVSKKLSLESKKIRESKISSKVRGNINTDMEDMMHSMADAPIGTKIVIKAQNSWHDVRAIYEKIGDDEWKHTHQVNGKNIWDTTRSTKSMYSELWNSIYSGTVISESKKILKEDSYLKTELTLGRSDRSKIRRNQWLVFYTKIGVGKETLTYGRVETVQKDRSQSNAMIGFNCYAPVIHRYVDVMNPIQVFNSESEAKNYCTEHNRTTHNQKLKEDLEDAISLKSKYDLIDYLKGTHLVKNKEYAIFTRDNYDFYIFWTRDRYNSPAHPIIQIDHDEDTIFHREGNPDSDDILHQAIEVLEGVRESRRIRRISNEKRSRYSKKTPRE